MTRTPQSLDRFLSPLISTTTITIEGSPPLKRGRPPLGERAMTPAEQKRHQRAPRSAAKLRHIAVLDTETDPFDDEHIGDILPFVAELYSDQFSPIVIWEDDFDKFIEKLVAAIESLPDEYTIYAHNGGKFDYMFLVSRLRGTVKFKGRAIMLAKLGNHELRDSLHILPEKLAAWKKDHFDYSKLKRCNRHKFRNDILAYLHSDCVYLFEIIQSFVKEFGLKISIGQAAFGELKKSYRVQHVTEQTDEFMRRYFFGGRVECIAGRGVFRSVDFAHRGPYQLYDVNSMYPSVMANMEHPVGNEYFVRRGEPDENTVFLDLECDNFGALVSRGETQEAGVDRQGGRFYTSIYEYRTSVKFGLIENVKINWCIDNLTRTNFSKFIVPMYDRRQVVKAQMRELKKLGRESTTDFEELKKQDLFLKYLLNNSFGKFAQNPRKFLEYYYTDAGEAPPKEWFDFLETCGDEIAHKYGMPIERMDDFSVWARPSPGRRYNNVGTAASITGAARAVLLEAIQNSVDPIYCDTDSLICRQLERVDIHASRLGAWDLEETFDEVIIAGKKEYACSIAGRPNGHEHRLKVRCKGADLRVRPMKRDGTEIPDATPEQWERANAATWQRYVDIVDGQIIAAINRAPTISKTGEQRYVRRNIRATAPRLTKPTIERRIKYA